VTPLPSLAAFIVRRRAFQRSLLLSAICGFRLTGRLFEVFPAAIRFRFAARLAPLSASVSSQTGGDPDLTNRFVIVVPLRFGLTSCMKSNAVDVRWQDRKRQEHGGFTAEFGAALMLGKPAKMALSAQSDDLAARAARSLERQQDGCRGLRTCAGKNGTFCAASSEKPEGLTFTPPLKKAHTRLRENAGASLPACELVRRRPSQ